jgi:serine/threonine-protein kinase
LILNLTIPHINKLLIIFFKICSILFLVVVSFVNSQTGHCLDSNTNGNVYPLAKNGGDYQKWVLTHVGNGEHNIRNVATGRYLDSNHNGDVYTLPHNGGSYQKWWLQETNVINVATGLALDCNGDRIYTLTRNGGNYQNWGH